MVQNVNQILGIDIGGTGVKAAPVDVTTGRIIAEPVRQGTPESATPEDLADVIRDLLDTFGWEKPVGIGYPGVVKNGTAYSAAHLSDTCIGFGLESLLQKLTKAPLKIINDADAAGLAEMKFGAGRDYAGVNGGTVLMLTLGTGIGSAIFTSGHLLPNTEFGHMIVDGHEAEDRAAASVRVAENLGWEEWSGRVNTFLAEMERLISPDLIIIGGGVAENFETYRQYLEADAELVRAVFGNDAGIIGAALIPALSG